MSFLRKEAWNFAVLLILLLATAAIAVGTTISFLHDQVPDDVRIPVTWAMWSLTLGFMLIAGAFAIWAIDFSVKIEARRAVRKLVGELHFLRDGLIAIDQEGQITGSNPPAEELAARAIAEDDTILDVLPAIAGPQADLLLKDSEPREIEVPFTLDGQGRNYRLRSHPTPDMRLIQISDVTSITREQEHARQAARLQLMGQIANGVANDLNTILCSITGHAALIRRLAPDAESIAPNLQSIIDETEQGIALAGQLVSFSRLGSDAGQATGVDTPLRLALDGIRAALPEDWQTDLNIEEGLPAVGLTALQLEQTVLNLGLHAAEQIARPGRLCVSATKPGSSGLGRVSTQYAAVVVITVGADDEEAADTLVVQPDDHETGAIQTILRSVLSGLGGHVEFLVDNRGWPVHRVCLPHAEEPDLSGGDGRLSETLEMYMADWSVLVAHRPSASVSRLTRRLDEMQAAVTRAEEISSALSYVQDLEALDVMVIDADMLGDGTGGLLRAILKLRPQSGLLVMGAGDEKRPAELAEDVAFVRADAALDVILKGMIDARTLAIRRPKE